MSSWTTKKFSEVTEFIQGGGTPSSNENSYWNGNILWLTPAEITNYPDIYISETQRHITEKGIENSSAKVFDPNTVLMTSRATIGNTVINTVPMATNQGFINIKPNEELKPEFLYFWINANRSFLESQGTGSTFKEISKGLFKNLQISYPAKEIQNNIVKILTTIKCKLKILNNKTKYYKQLKQSLIEYIYERDEPNTSFSDILEIKKCTFDPKKETDSLYIGLEHMESGSLTINKYGNSKELLSTKFKFNQGNILFGRLRPYLNKAAVSSSSGVCSTDIIVMESQINPWYTIGYLHTKRFINFTKANTSGTNHPRVKWDSLSNFKIYLPSDSNEIEKGADVIKSLANKLSILELKSKTYTQLYYTMINKLMNQEIEVSNLEFENVE